MGEAGIWISAPPDDLTGVEGDRTIVGEIMNIFGIGLPEMAVILVVALLIFGPKKLPEIGRSMGEAIRKFQDASQEFKNEFNREAEQLEQATRSHPPKSETNTRNDRMAG